MMVYSTLTGMIATIINLIKYDKYYNVHLIIVSYSGTYHTVELVTLGTTKSG